jgi:UDP-GlcNAc:undecaprenyl-phosphate GlcNAc-1-phosphate transferase
LYHVPDFLRLDFTGMLHQVLAAGGAFALALIVTPLFRRFAIRVGLVDHPDPDRKLHQGSIALSGGVAVFLSLAIAGGFVLFSRPDILGAVLANPIPVLGLGIASVGIVGLGLLDDAMGLRGRQKLAGQVMLVSILVFSGFQMNSIRLLGWDLELGLLAIPISIGWLLLTVNALNLIDGADGLCSTVGWIASAGIAAMAALSGHVVESTIAAALAGALLGFLVFNFPPAKIFLGDTGSMLVGLLLGALALHTSLKGAAAISLLGPVTILAIPIFDSSMAILRRKLTGRSLFAVDRAHLHHNLLRVGMGHRAVVGLVTLLCGTVALGAFLSTALNNELVALVSLVAVLGCLIASRIFGYAELTLLANRIVHFGGSLLARSGTSDGLVRKQMVRLQGNRSWETIWATLLEFADRQELAKVCLDLNIPWLHEGFHASWQVNRMPDVSERWNTRLPIVSQGRLLGRLEIVGKLRDDKIFLTLAQLAEMLESLQPDIERLASEIPHSGSAAQSAEPVQQLSISNATVQ